MRIDVDRYDGKVWGMPEDGMCIPVTQSQFKRLECPRRFVLQVVAGLEPEPSAAMRTGAAWDLVSEDVYRHGMWADGVPYERQMAEGPCRWCPADRDACEACGGTGMGPIERAVSSWVEAEMSAEDVEKETTRLRRMLDGYLHRWSEAFAEFRVVAVKVRVARGVPSYRGSGLYRPETVLQQDGDGWVLAGPGAVASGAECRVVSWPYYQLCELDAVLEHRRDGGLCVVDAKATSSPDSWLQRIDVDPQLQGYAWALQNHPGFGERVAQWVMYDVTSSRYQHDPRVLQWKPPKIATLRAMAKQRGLDTSGLRKSMEFCELLGITEGHGGFSQAENAGVPAYRYERALERDGLDRGPYEEHIAAIRRLVDVNLYRRERRQVTPEDLATYEVELYARVAQVARIRRWVARASDWSEVLVVAPRVPVCGSPGGYCPVEGPCALGRGYNGHAMPVAGPKVRWSDPPPEPARGLLL